VRLQQEANERKAPSFPSNYSPSSIFPFDIPQSNAISVTFAPALIHRWQEAAKRGLLHALAAIRAQNIVRRPIHADATPRLKTLPVAGTTSSAPKVPKRIH